MSTIAWIVWTALLGVGVWSILATEGLYQYLKRALHAIAVGADRTEYKVNELAERADCIEKSLRKIQGYDPEEEEWDEPGYGSPELFEWHREFNRKYDEQKKRQNEAKGEVPQSVPQSESHPEDGPAKL